MKFVRSREQSRRPSYKRSRRSIGALIEAVERRQMMTSLVTFDMNSNTGKAASQSGSAVTGLTTTDFTRGGSLFVPNSGEITQTGTFYGTPQQSDGQYSSTETTATTGAVAKQHYFTFTVTPAAGKALSTTSIDMALFGQTGKKVDYAIEYSVGGGAYVTGLGVGSTTNTTGSGTLLSAAVAVPATTSAVTFRIVIYSDMRTSSPIVPDRYYERTSIGWHTGADVVLNGTVADATPAAPTAFAAAPDIHGLGNILTWTDNATNETGFVVERSTSSTFSGTLTTFSVAANAITYEDTAVTVGTKYYYRVHAVNAAGNSANATAASTRTMQITEGWVQEWYPGAFTDNGHSDWYRPSSLDFAGPFKNVGTTDIATYATAAPDNSVFTIDDENNELFGSDIYDSTKVTNFINAQKADVVTARAAHNNLQFGIYSILPPPLSSTSPDYPQWEIVADEMLTALIQPGVYYDFAAPPIYSDGTDFASRQTLNQEGINFMTQSKYSGMDIRPFFSTTALFGTVRQLTSTEIGEVAALVNQTGDKGIRWDQSGNGSTTGTLGQWTTAYGTSQATFVSDLAAS